MINSTLTATRLIELPHEFTVFKVVGNETGLLEYSANHPPRQSDWAAVYAQFSTANALGTAFYRIDQGYDVARLLAIDVACGRAVRALLVADEWFGAPDASGDAKARAVRAWLHEHADVPLDDARALAAQLGERRLVLLCRESVDEWELVVPAQLLAAGAPAGDVSDGAGDDASAVVRIVRERVACELQLDRVRCQVSNMAAAEASVERHTTPQWLLDEARIT